MRHRLDSAFARRVGFFRTPDGLDAHCHHRWNFRVPAGSFRLVEASAAREPLMGSFVHDATRVWLAESAPGSNDGGLRRCEDSDLPHYVAIDRHGPFGDFECGGITRLRR